MITGKRQREIGLVVPAKIIVTTNSEVLEKELSIEKKGEVSHCNVEMSKEGRISQISLLLFHKVKVKKHGSILLNIVLCFKHTPLYKGASIRGDTINRGAFIKNPNGASTRGGV